MATFLLCITPAKVRRTLEPLILRKRRLHHEAKYLVLSFPYSNGGFLQLNYGENMECLLEGLVAIFEHIGGVPTEIWFDNTRTHCHQGY